MKIIGFIFMVSLTHVISAADITQCMGNYNRCLTTFGIHITGTDDLVPSIQGIYSEQVINRLCSNTTMYVGCYDTVMKCIMENTTVPGVMTSADLSSLMTTTCKYKTEMIAGNSCLERINYTQIATGCSNQTQPLIAKLIDEGVSMEYIICRSSQLATSCVFSSPKLLSCGADLVRALRAISDESTQIMCDKVSSTTVSSTMVSQYPAAGIVG
ncbi:uncharacterized protein [Argopecten irradians]|uniref:uncharacterized protein n=1 Tax=Argopecten irradians TaxID=31199 RepID=UPI003720BA50